MAPTSIRKINELSQLDASRSVPEDVIGLEALLIIRQSFEDINLDTIIKAILRHLRKSKPELKHFARTPMCISCLSEHGLRKDVVLVNTTIPIRAPVLMR